MGFLIAHILYEYSFLLDMVAQVLLIWNLIYLLFEHLIK